MRVQHAYEGGHSVHGKRKFQNRGHGYEVQ